MYIKAGELQKISVPIGAETHVRLPGIPAPEGYVVTFTNGDDIIAYEPHGEVMLAKETHTVFVAYGEQQYEFQTDFKTLAESTETSVQDSFRDLLPWVYQVRNPNGRLLSDGLVYPDQDSQEVTVELADAYIGHSNETPSILLVAAGTGF